MKKNTKGSALIVVLCVGCVFIFISLALLLAVSVLMTQAQNATIDDRCRILASTFSRSIDSMLSAPYDAVSQTVEPNDLRSYLRGGIAGESNRLGEGFWPNYKEGEPGHEKFSAYRSLEFDFKENSSDTGNYTVQMYWEYDEEEADPKPTLYVIVTCEYKKRKQIITTQYELLINSVVTDPSTGTKFAQWRWTVAWRS